MPSSVREAGVCPPLVLMAGLSSRATHFNHLAPLVGPHCRRVVLLDLPGHGLSDVPCDGLSGPTLQRGVVAALDQILEEPAVVFGNSLGGFMALRHALHSPAKVRALVLASPGGAQMDSQRLGEFLEQFRLLSHGDALDLIDRVFCESPAGVRHVMAFFARRQLARASMRGLLESSRPEDLLSVEELEGLRVPVRMIWGTADRVLPTAHRAFFKAALPHADWRQPEDYSHSPFIERPRDLAARILEFAERHAAPRLRLIEAS